MHLLALFMNMEKNVLLYLQFAKSIDNSKNFETTNNFFFSITKQSQNQIRKCHHHQKPIYYQL